jgi:hypothetical protein
MRLIISLQLTAKSITKPNWDATNIPAVGQAAHLGVSRLVHIMKKRKATNCVGRFRLFGDWGFPA